MGKYGDQKSPKEIMILLSQNVIVLRKQEKMSQRVLSERSGVSESSIKTIDTSLKTIRSRFSIIFSCI